LAKKLGGGTYLPQFISDQTTGQLLSVSGFISKIFKNLSQHLFVNLPTMFFPIGQASFTNQSGLGIIIGLIFIITIVIGIIREFKTKQYIFSVYVVLTILLLVSFSEMAVIVRYLVVIYPFITILLIFGLEKILFRFKQKQGIIFGIFFIIMLLALPKYIKMAKENSMVRSEYTKGNKYAGYDPALLNFIEVNEWLKKNDTTAVGVISRKPTLTWWFSGHPAQGYIWKSDVNQVKANIDSLGAKYVIVDQISSSTPQFLIPTIRAFPESFKVLYVTKRPETYVLEIFKADSSNILHQ